MSPDFLGINRDKSSTHSPAKHKQTFARYPRSVVGSVLQDGKDDRPEKGVLSQLVGLDCISLREIDTTTRKFELYSRGLRSRRDAPPHAAWPLGPSRPHRRHPSARSALGAPQPASRDPSCGPPARYGARTRPVQASPRPSVSTQPPGVLQQSPAQIFSSLVLAGSCRGRAIGITAVIHQEDRVGPRTTATVAVATFRRIKASLMGRRAMLAV